MLLYRPLKKRLGPFYARQFQDPKQKLALILENSREVRAAFAESNIWMFSQPKTGTTFLCNTIAFYNASCVGVDHSDFDDLAKFGVLRAGRAGHIIEKRLISGALHFLRTVQNKKLLVHSHNNLDVTNCRYLLLTRNPYDFCVSSYYYYFKNRESTADKKFGEAIPTLVSNYSKIYHDQRKIIAEREKVMVVRYEELMSDPKSLFYKIIFYLYAEVNEAALEKALEETTISKVRQWEQEAGRALVVMDGGGYTKSSFIRSGKVNEYKEVLTDSEIEQIKALLTEYGIEEDGTFKSA